MYTYIDYATGKYMRTKGTFVGWHKGQLGIWYAKFQLQTRILYVREHLLSIHTKAALPARENK